MDRTYKLSKLKNIGKTIAERLNEVNIFDKEDLISVGPVNAYKRLKMLYPTETLPLCYYLYSFEGAILNLHWDAIGKERKAALKAQCYW